MTFARKLAVALISGAAVFASTAPAATPTTLYSFKGSPDGGNPFAGVVYHAGTVYGTTGRGGTTNNYGTVFAVDVATGAETVLHSFIGGATDGILPISGLVYHAGLLYGATVGGGTGDVGIVFSIDPATGAEQILHSFGASRKDGSSPGGLSIYHNTIYGTTTGGGRPRYGIIFSIDLATGVEKILHEFQGGANDGSMPSSGLVFLNGAFYGTTSGGGPYDTGTIYKFDPVGRTESVVYSFGASGSGDGIDPRGGLTYVGSLLYGASVLGGASGAGALFQFDPVAGTQSIAYSFSRGRYTQGPAGPLVLKNGTLYGTTDADEWKDNGALFSFDTGTGSLHLTYRFQNGDDGGEPATGLVFSGGYFYGATTSGGTSGAGTVYRIRR